MIPVNYVNFIHTTQCRRIASEAGTHRLGYREVDQGQCKSYVSDFNDWKRTAWTAFGVFNGQRKTDELARAEVRVEQTAAHHEAVRVQNVSGRHYHTARCQRAKHGYSTSRRGWTSVGFDDNGPDTRKQKYSGFQTAWDNVAPDQQTLNNLQERLIRKEARLTVANEETGAFSKCKKNGIKKNDAGAQNKITKSDCQIGKLQRKVLNKVHERPATKPAEVFHMNVWWPMSVESLGGASYYALFKDDATRFHYVYFLRHKSDEIKKFKILDKIGWEQMWTKN